MYPISFLCAFSRRHGKQRTCFERCLRARLPGMCAWFGVWRLGRREIVDISCIIIVRYRSLLEMLVGNRETPKCNRTAQPRTQGTTDSYIHHNVTPHHTSIPYPRESRSYIYQSLLQVHPSAPLFVAISR